MENRHTADYRRERGHASYNRLTRDEYIQRAHEFAPKGERAAKKLTADCVRAIRENRNGYSYEKLAEIFDVTPNTIYRVSKRITWAFV